MTPLPWWVLLATLLGRAIGVPIHEQRENACVRFCRTLGASEACDFRIFALLQSYERQVGRPDQLARCFISCDENEDFGQEGKKEICEKARKDFVQEGLCGCLDPFKEIPSKWIDPSEEDPSLNIFEEILARFHRFILEIGTPGTLDLVEESEDSLNIFSIEIDRTKTRRDESGDFVVEEVPVDSQESQEEKTILEGKVQEPEKVEDHLAATTESTSSEEHVDWEMWCMTQCDHGLGGTACNCDIIP